MKISSASENGLQNIFFYRKGDTVLMVDAGYNYRNIGRHLMNRNVRKIREK